mgnify:CR=1 FL=1
MTYIKNKEKYKHTSKGNTIISFYCSSKLQDAIDKQRGKVSRSVFIVDILSKELGVKLDD